MKFKVIDKGVGVVVGVTVYHWHCFNIEPVVCGQMVRVADLKIHLPVTAVGLSHCRAVKYMRKMY